MTGRRARAPAGEPHPDHLIAELHYEDSGCHRRMVLDESLYDLEVTPAVRVRPASADDPAEVDDGLDALFVEVVGAALDTDGWGRAID
ncbi:MAG TPA: hypothetical protein DEF51_53415 [Myxococcales bacterium]|nr:hypothetical protein [Myxococcales bacterium]